jgi:hypothetical protein
MTDYKKELLELLDDITKKFYLKPRSKEFEETSFKLIEKIKKQIIEQDQERIMFMLLKIIASEGVMINGARRINNTGRDA